MEAIGHESAQSSAAAAVTHGRELILATALALAALALLAYVSGGG